MKFGDLELGQQILFQDTLDQVIEENANAWRQILLEFDIPLTCHEKRSSSLLLRLIQQERTVNYVISKLEFLNLYEPASCLYEKELLKIDKQSPIVVKGDCTIEKDGSIQVKAGGILSLSVKASGKPIPSYHWYHNRKLLLSSHQQTLTIQPFREDFTGEYQCYVTQRQIHGTYRRKFPQRLNVRIRHETMDCIQTDKPLQIRLNPPLPVRLDPAVKKRALILGNSNYKNNCYSTLDSPQSDASQMHKTLQNKYGFECTVKLDLPGEAMETALCNFCETLESNSLVLFYFAGHGFTNSKLQGMLGTDATKTLTKQHVLTEVELKNKILPKDPCKFICIFDTCLTERLNEFPFDLLTVPVGDNYVEWNATSLNCEAFEMERENTKQSVFMHYFLQVFDSKCEENWKSGSGFISMAMSVHRKIQEAKQKDRGMPVQYPTLQIASDFVLEPVAQQNRHAATTT